MKLTIEEIIEATGAEVIKNETKLNDKFSFSTDTRMIKKGEIYLPLKGENFDGEKFIDKAIEAGAAGYFCTKNPSPALRAPSPAGGEGEDINPSLILQVEDTLIAYLELARFCRRKINPKTVAVTGSCGKTTTKEMAYCVVSQKFKTHKSELNFNNEIGLSKTILSMPEDTQVLILEMGMRGLGEIELLSKYAEPDISIIANVGTAHIGRLGSRENVAKAKCEIVKFMKEGGALIAHDDKLIRQEIEEAKPLLTSHYFSLNNTKIIEKKVGYSKFVYRNNVYELNIEGDYNVQNALAVIEMGIELKISPYQINEGLKNYAPIEKRWEVQNIKGLKIINDSYNANPESMKAAIETFLDVYSPPLLLILGDMGELGEDEALYHAQIGDFLSQKLSLGCHCEASAEAIQKTSNSWIASSQGSCLAPRNDKMENVKIITVGKLASEISKKLIDKGISSQNFDDNIQTVRYIVENVKNGTTIILKASRAMKFEEILNEVTKRLSD